MRTKEGREACLWLALALEDSQCNRQINLHAEFYLWGERKEFDCTSNILVFWETTLKTGFCLSQI